mgnify:CR=1 FL=1
MENEVQTVQEGEAAQHKGPVLEAGVECDWAHWYLPHTGTVRPARVTIRSKTKKIEQSKIQKFNAIYWKQIQWYYFKAMEMCFMIAKW